jgi:hypothetical protein
MLFRAAVLLLSALSLIFEADAHIYQTPAAQKKPARSLLNKLKPQLRPLGRSLVEEADERKRAQLVLKLAQTDLAGAMDFLLALLPGESSARVRSAIVDSLGRQGDVKSRAALERLASSDADVSVALLALERLRALRNQETRALLLKRIELARANKDEAALGRLLQETERWISLVRGTMLPSFMRTPPAPFSLKSAEQPVRVLAFGDFGVGSSFQKQTAQAMMEYHRRSPFDFAITLGDNFYDAGMASPTDQRWKTLWDDLYDPLGLKVYAVLGNHDWRLSDSPAAEILYSQLSPSWRMPSPYYTFTAGQVQFFALDTNEVSEAQLVWLDEAIKRSSARWKIAYGHHPIYNDGAHGDSRQLIEQLLPLLKGRVDAYFAGHDHNLQHLKAEEGVHFFISGGGGARLYEVKREPRALFSQSTNGFTVIEADVTELKVRMIDKDSRQLYEYAMKK